MILSVERLSVGFRTPSGVTPVVREVSLALEAGERLALVGESGCGKTVVALALLGLLPRNARVDGLARFEERQLLDPRVAAALRGREIAMCWSNAERYFNPVMPIGPQIEEAYARRGRGGGRAARRQTLSLLCQVGFEEPERVYRSYPFQLSGGMNQRAMIAMSLINSPRLLLVDEPTRGLDDLSRDRVVRCLLAIAGPAMLLITHDLKLVQQAAHRVCFMRAGVIVDGGPIPEALRTTEHPYSREMIRAGLDD